MVGSVGALAQEAGDEIADAIDGCLGHRGRVQRQRDELECGALGDRQRPATKFAEELMMVRRTPMNTRIDAVVAEMRPKWIALVGWHPYRIQERADAVEVG